MIVLIVPFRTFSKYYEIEEGFHCLSLATGPFIIVANRMTMAHSTVHREKKYIPMTLNVV